MQHDHLKAEAANGTYRAPPCTLNALLYIILPPLLLPHQYIGRIVMSRINLCLIVLFEGLFRE